MTHLHDHGIGPLAHAFDIPGSTITSNWSWSPTDCATSQGGSGKQTKNYFATRWTALRRWAPVPGLSVSAPTPTRLAVSWQAATGPVDSCHVPRDGAVLGSTPDLSFSDTSVEPTHTYGYAVQAVDAQGNSIQMDYREDTGSSIVKLSWSSPSVAKSVVPASQLLAK